MPDDGVIIVKPHTSMHAIFQKATDPLLKVFFINQYIYSEKSKFFLLFQSINDRMTAQDPNVTFSTPKLSHAIERMLKSKTQIVKISEIDATMLKIRLSYTTSSGTTYLLRLKKQISETSLNLQVNLTFTFQKREFIPLI